LPTNVGCMMIKLLAVSSEQPDESSVHVRAKKINLIAFSSSMGIASSDAIRVCTVLNCFFCRFGSAHNVTRAVEDRTAPFLAMGAEC